MPRKKLKDNHRIAAEEYMSNGFVKSEAMRKAGFAETSCTSRSGLVFDREDVKEFIKERQDKIAKKYELDQEWVVQRLMKNAMSGETLAKFKVIQSDGTLAWDFTGATEEELSVVSDLGVEFYTEGRGPEAIEVKKFKVKLPDVHAALVALGRHQGMFTDKVEVTDSLEDRLAAGRKRAYDKADEKTVH